MKKNRRLWLRQAGLGIVGLGIGRIKAFAPPVLEYVKSSPGEFPIRLNLNENPYGPSPTAQLAMHEHVNMSNRYHWRQTSRLVDAIAKKNNIKPENILLGAGASEILTLILRYTALKKGSFILSDPTYSNWTKSAAMLGCEKIEVPLNPDKQHNLDAILRAIKSDTQLIYVCNPNNPTGTICERDALITFIKEATKKAIVLVDEAYLDYSDQKSVIELAAKNINLIVVRTFSKMYGLAGARIGYAAAHRVTIDNLSLLQSWPPESIGVVSVAGAIASLEDKEFVKENYSLNKNVRKYTIKQLEHLNITCIPTDTNFIYFSLSKYQKDFFKQLENNNIIGTEIYEQHGQWSRITVGTMQEMEMFISALE